MVLCLVKLPFCLLPDGKIQSPNASSNYVPARVPTVRHMLAAEAPMKHEDIRGTVIVDSE